LNTHILQKKSYSPKYSSKKILIDGTEWQYYDLGKGKKTLVIFPNILLFPQEWLEYVKVFDKTYRVIIPVYPPLSDYRLMVRQLHTLLHLLQVKRFVLLGNSIGGMFAQAYSVSYPEDVEKLILLATIAPSKGYGSLVRMLSVIGHMVPSTLVQAFVAFGIAISLTKSEENRKKWGPLLKKHISHKGTKLSILSLAGCIYSFCFGLKEEIKQKVPLTIIDAQKDAVFPFIFQNLSKIYPQAVYYSIPNAKHLVEINKKESLVQILQALI